MEINFKDLKIRQIKEDVNLFMFNSKHFSVNDMILMNQITEVLENVKIQFNSN